MLCCKFTCINKQQYMESINKAICCYCETEITTEEITKEHLVPISIGGNNSTFNKRPCCLKCNRLRGCKPLFVFRFQLKKSLTKNKLYKGFTIEQTKKAIKNTHIIQKYIDENLQILTQ